MKALLIFAVWRGIYWGLVGGFLWSMGVLAGHLAGGPEAQAIGGGVSLALFTGLLLAASRFRRLKASMLPMGAAMCAGIFAALLPAQLWLGELGMILAAALGFVVGMMASVPRIGVGLHDLAGRFLIGAAAGAAVGTVGAVFANGLGWTIAGALGGLVLALPALSRTQEQRSWHEPVESTLSGAVAGALAGFTGLWLMEHALALPQPHPPLLGLQTGDKVMQWLYHALLWPALLFLIQLASLAWRRRWRERLRSRQRPGVGVDAGHNVSGASKAHR